jgi:hypothetical protein
MSASETRSFLLNSATPELYRRNAFRLTGLGVTAGARELVRQMDKLKTLAELGGQAAQMGHGGGGGAGATAEELREAGQRLKQVEARSLYEFFWFWPLEWENAPGDKTLASVRVDDLEGAMQVWREWEKGISGDEALSALLEYDMESALKIWEGWKNEAHWQMGLVAAHNLAVGLHMLALEKTRADVEEGSPFDHAGAEALQKMWIEVQIRWQAVIHADAVWEIFHTRIRQVNDPALTTSFARRLRQDLQTALTKVNAEVAMRYVKCEKLMEADYHACYVKVESRNNETVVELLKEMLAPWRSRIEKAVLAAEEAAGKEVQKGMLHATALLETTEPLLKVIGMFYDPEDEISEQVFNRVAAAVTDMTVTAYENLGTTVVVDSQAGDPYAGQGMNFIEILQRAEGLASGPELVRYIAEKISVFRAARTADQIFTKLMASVQATPCKNPAVLLKRVEGVLPELEGYLKEGTLDEESQKQLSNCMAHFFREYVRDFQNSMDNTALVKRALMLAARYARDPGLIKELREEGAKVLEKTSGNQLFKKGCLIPCVAIWVVAAAMSYFFGERREAAPLLTMSWEQVHQEQEASLAMLLRTTGHPEEKGKVPLTGIHWVKDMPGSYGGYLVLQATPGEGDFYVKLVGRGTGVLVMGIYVRDGEGTYPILLRTGSYEVSFAHGGAWRDEKELFGPETRYRRMLSDVSFDRGNRHALQLSKEAGTLLSLDWRAGGGF